MMRHSKYPRVRITRLYKMMILSLSRFFQERGLPVTNEQEIILRTLHDNEKISQIKLAEYTGQDKNNLSRTIALLEKKGYVLKKTSKPDKRFCEITLSEEGKQMQDQTSRALEYWRKHIFFKGITAEEGEQFTNVLEKIMANLETPLK